MLTAYAQPNKDKSRVVLEAFARGCAGQLAERYELQDGTAAFYGVVGLENLWRAVRARGDFVYLDNAFFDRARGTHFRATRDALQPTVIGRADWHRLTALGLDFKDWCRDGRHIVVCMQSEHFMTNVAEWPAPEWLQFVERTLKAHTDRPIVIRDWGRDKGERARSLHRDLDGAWALVTHMSAAANEAVLAGVPVFVTGDCAALPMGLSQLESIESPRRPDGRQEWAAGLAAAQWTLEEMREGAAWRSLNA